jgi:hypothetical protein
LPAFLGLGYLYKRFKARHLLAVLLVFLVLASTQIPRFDYAIQRSLTRTGEAIDRLSFEYRAPYFRLYLIAKDSGKTLVVGGLEMRGIQTYMSMLPNVVLIRVPRTENDFEARLKLGWDFIFLYDDWYTMKDPSIVDSYPGYYRGILLSRSYPGYVVTTLWVDGESYALEMVKVGTQTAAVPANAFQSNLPGRAPAMEPYWSGKVLPGICSVSTREWRGKFSNGAIY